MDQCRSSRETTAAEASRKRYDLDLLEALRRGNANYLVEALHGIRGDVLRHEGLVQLALLPLLSLLAFALVVHLLHFSVAEDFVKILGA
jgi:hypothetical protein